MQDSYYSTPLHGVECLLPNQPVSYPQLKRLKLIFEPVTIPGDCELVWSLVDQGQRYKTELNLYKTPHSFVLRVNCEGEGAFEVTTDSVSIDWSGGTQSSHYFQTIGLSLWLELQGVLCLHGNALEFQQNTFALVAGSGTGKSTMSTQLQYDGAYWLTDDMMAMHQDSANGASKGRFSIYPSWPIARLWPDSIENVSKIDQNGLEKVHDRFSKRLIELPRGTIKSEENSYISSIYFLHRTDTQGAYDKADCKIERLTSSQALILLLQHSMLGNAYSALGLEAQRMAVLSRLINAVEVKQVTYKSGKGNLELVSNTILEDVSKG